jgi:hypothetical protein
LQADSSYREEGPPFRGDENVDVAREFHLVVTEVIVHLLPSYQVAQGSDIVNTWKGTSIIQSFD